MDDFAFIRRMKTLDIDLEELPDIFEILDDGDGELRAEPGHIDQLRAHPAGGLCGRQHGAHIPADKD